MRSPAVVRPPRGGLKLLLFRGSSRETHVSTAQPPPQEEARVSVPHEVPPWPRGPSPSSRQRESAADRLVTTEERSAQYRPFPATERLKKQAEFERIFRRGASFHGVLIVLFVLRAAELPRRAGFVAGRKVGGAVQRNRAKRLLREAYRSRRGDLPQSGIQFVLVARKGCSGAHADAVRAELGSLLDRALRSSSSQTRPQESSPGA